MGDHENSTCRYRAQRLRLHPILRIQHPTTIHRQLCCLRILHDLRGHRFAKVFLKTLVAVSTRRTQRPYGLIMGTLVAVSTRRTQRPYGQGLKTLVAVCTRMTYSLKTLVAVCTRMMGRMGVSVRKGL